MVDGGISPADGARVTMTDWHRSELHGLGIKRQQTVRQQFTNTRKILQCLCRLNRTQHASNGSQHSSLRTSGHSSHGEQVGTAPTGGGSLNIQR